jgi:DNA-binding protein HU-beta
MNKKGLARALTERIPKDGAGKILFSQKQALRVIDEMLAVIEQKLIEGDIIRLVGFGSFQVKKRKQRIGINPQTMEKLIIPELPIVVFTRGRSLKRKVRNISPA